MKIVWTYTAQAHLRAIRLFIDDDNPIAAKQVVFKIFRSVKQLSSFPESGRAGRLTGTREFVISGLPYIISYQIRKDHIEILQVLHTAMKWPEEF
ncbi:MAG: type II toxin-antitoxin system RelE/ParE family toxin [Magnetococcales bacterium]|nr:type II toxin-antitoxin system RelE/ParE family toxin [Magnetococcales bacterium]